ncbi:MAG: Gfo/Idh/MocA family oxidoreductase [Chloroflexota bacterium]|nr:Gfo/Idh/MocA family oxidoreductase [Chloroflexota bacterium]
MQSIKTAIVGYGYAGRVFHAQLIGATEGLELYAVSTRDPQRRQQAAQDLDVKTYPSLDELLKDDEVQLVVLATPHDTHKELAIHCLDAGKHVVSEKIMCLDTSEADSMIEASRRNGRMLSVFHNRRWDCGYLTLKRAVADGLLGDLLVVESRVVGWRHPRPDRWRSQRRHGGGSLRDWGAHLIDQALQLIDSPVVSVYCDMLYTEPKIDVETSARCCMTFDNGVRYLVETGFISALPRPRWYVRGTRGAFRKLGLDPQERALNQGQVNSGLPLPPDERAEVRIETEAGMETRVFETIPGNWPAYYQNIADHLLRDAELVVKPEQARRAVAIIETAAESADEDQVISCRI